MAEGGTRLAGVRRDYPIVRSQPGAMGANGRPPPGGQARVGQQQGAGAARVRLAEVARGGTLNLVGALIAGVATVGITIIVTRHFSKPVAGAFFTAISVFLIAEAIASLGTNVGLVYYIARLRSLGQAVRIPVIMRAAVLPVAVVSVVATAALLLGAAPLADILVRGNLGQGGVTPENVAAALRALAITLPCAALLDALLGASQGYRDMRPSVVVDRIGRSVIQLLGILVAVALGSAALLAPLWALPYVPAVAIVALWVRRIRRNPSPQRAAMLDVPPELAALLALSTPVLTGPKRGSFSGRHRTPGSEPQSRRPGSRGPGLVNTSASGFWRFTTPRGIASVASIILQRVDIVLVAIMINPAAAAVYTAATRFLVAGQFASMAIARAAQPRLTEMFTVGDVGGTNLLYQVTTAWLVLMTWPLYLLTAVYGPLVLSVFGSTYRAGSAVMLILALTMLLATACGQVDVVLITSGRSSWSLANGLVQVVFNVGLDLILIPKYGITGAAIGWAVAIVMGNLIPLAQLGAVMRLHPFGRGTLIAVLLSAVSFGVIPLAARAFLGDGGAALVVGIAGGCLVQAAGMWWFRGPLRLAAMPGLSSLRRRKSAARNLPWSKAVRQC